jgi:predicted ArsR family transcriptional regulator
MSTPDEAWASMAVLAEPTRRRVFDAVRESRGPVTREAAAAAVGITPRLAAFHLDRLAEAGLLLVDYARPSGRGGPGAGRPAKRYAPAPVELEVTVPPRRYNLVARILAAAIADAPQAADEGARAAAHAEGRQAGELHRQPRRRGATSATAGAVAALERLGYEPIEDEDHRVRLRNCPFHDVVDVAPALVCGLNKEVVAGVLEGLDVQHRCRAQLDGVPPDCCVTVSQRPRRNTVVSRRKGRGHLST